MTTDALISPTLAINIHLVFIIWLSHKDWELPNSRIWLAEIDIESGLDFPT